MQRQYCCWIFHLVVPSMVTAALPLPWRAMGWLLMGFILALACLCLRQLLFRRSCKILLEPQLVFILHWSTLWFLWALAAGTLGSPSRWCLPLQRMAGARPPQRWPRPRLIILP